MIKFVSMFSIADGNDLEKVWKYWIETHAANARKLPGIKKYSINRVTQPISGHAEGENGKFWGMAEIWFDDMEAYNKYLVLRPKDDHWVNMYKPQFAVWMEEKEIN
jgi:uncharacterized protein (TIGR02118 family)